MGDNNLMDLDLNQEPSTDPPVESIGSFLDELETPIGRIEDRIRQLEAVVARARQRQRWRVVRNSMEICDFSGDRIVREGGSVDGNNGACLVDMTAKMRIGCKRDSSHLVAKALEMDAAEVKKAEKDSGNFYDCNICLDVAKDPVLTCCGHLFCWACFYQLSFIDSIAKECPVCRGEVSDNTVTPIYGNGASDFTEIGSDLKIPPRPKAHRVESVRQQQRVARGLSHVRVAEALRRIRIGIGAMGDRTQQQEGGSNNSSQGAQNSVMEGTNRVPIQLVPGVLSDNEASLSSRSSSSGIDARHEDNQGTAILNGDAWNTRGDEDPDSPTSPSSHSREASGAIQQMLRMRALRDIHLHMVPSSSSRGRTSMPYVVDRGSRESRRRFR